jgi:hypothetical protein
MGGGLLAVCDPVLLQREWTSDTLREPRTLDFDIVGRNLRVGGSAGLTQVMSADGIGTLSVPARVTLRGKATEGSYLYIHAASVQPEHYATGEALFRGLGLSHRGTATIDVQLQASRVTFVFRHAGGGELKPLRWSHVEGPGAGKELPPLPEHYADTPKQGLKTYVAALNARDGKTLCRLWTPDARARLTRDPYPCWATATTLIDYGGDSGSPVFQRTELLKVGRTFERGREGVTFTAVPVTLHTYYLESKYSDKHVTSEDQVTVAWFRKTSDGWRIAGDPFFFSGQSAAVPPDPYAAQHAREAEELKKKQLRLARRRSLVEFRKVPPCPTPALVLHDRLGDVLQGPPSAAPRGRARTRAASDIVRSSLALGERRACFSVKFQARPLTGPQQIRLGLSYTPVGSPAPRAYVEFGVENDLPIADGLHAGLSSPPSGAGALAPAGARLGVRSKTLTAWFRLPSDFPKDVERRRLGLTVSSNGRSRDGSMGVYDTAEVGLTAQKAAADAAKAQRKREAKERAAEQARQAVAWAPARARFASGTVHCGGKAIRAKDPASDVQIMRRGTVIHSNLALSDFSDLRSASVSVTGRHVCFAVTFARQPFGSRQRRFAFQVGLGLNYRTKTPPYLRRAPFAVQTNVQLENSLTYAGILTPSGPTPANAHVELHGRTLRADFELDPSFPLLRPVQLKGLSWSVSFSGTDLRTLRLATPQPLTSHDQLPDNPYLSTNSISPEIRQSDGKKITPR